MVVVGFKEGKKRSPHYSVFDLWLPVAITIDATILAGVSSAVVAAASRHDDSHWLSDVGGLGLYILAVCVALFLFRATSFRHDRMWVTEFDVGCLGVTMPRSEISIVVVRSLHNSDLTLIDVYDTSGRHRLSCSPYPHPRWRWIRFLRKAGFDVRAEPWRVPLLFNPAAMLRLFREC